MTSVEPDEVWSSAPVVWSSAPFDRMLVAQAQCERLTLVTGDVGLARCDVAALAGS
jgi:PIN domain nuclease of toxin-antitoxin system